MADGNEALSDARIIPRNDTYPGLVEMTCPKSGKTYQMVGDPEITEPELRRRILEMGENNC